jgi:hypothetical protein
MLFALVLTAACSHSGGYTALAADAFADGTCRAVAADVLALGAAVDRLGDGPKVSAEVKTELREAQDRLSDVAAAAEPSYKPALDALVQSAGAVRIRADGNSYESSLGARMGTDYEAVVAVCT